jgi:hypothetical protein
LNHCPDAPSTLPDEVNDRFDPNSSIQLSRTDESEDAPLGEPSTHSLCLSDSTPNNNLLSHRSFEISALPQSEDVEG